MRHAGLKLVVMGSLAALAIACGKKEGDAPKNMEGIDYPEWVTKGSGAFGGEEKVFYGVGSVSGIRDQSLATTTADNRARAEIAKIFEVYTAQLMKDYMAATTSGDEAADEEMHVEVATKTFTAATLSGVQIVDHWFHPEGTVYALARLDLEQFTNNLDRMEELNARVRDYVRQNAERVHEDLEKEEAKRAQQ